MNHFQLAEFNCPCCGKHSMDALFLVALDRAREFAGVPFQITSGYRCPKHNAEVGSTSTNHTSGKAADIAAADVTTRGKIVKGLYLAGFTRVGISFKNGFVHVDSNDSNGEALWGY